MEDLDKLAADFAARGYEPEGAELERDETAAGHTQGHEPGAAAHGHGTGVRRFTYPATTSRSSRAMRC